MRKFAITLLAVLLAFVFSACSSSNGSSNGGNTGSGNGAATDSSNQNGGGGDTGEKKIRSVGMTLMTLDNPYFVAYKEALDELAAKEGFTATTESADFDLAKQQAQIEAFIQKKVDVILLNAVDSRGIAGAVQQAVAANIPVIAVDVEADGGVTTSITSDNFQAGQLAGQYLVEKLNGKGNVVLINGNPVTSVFDRVDGFKDAIKDYPDIKIIEDQNGKLNRDDSYKVFENILASHPEGTIDAVFGVNDPTSIGAYLAAKAANRSDFFFVSVDGSQAAVDIMKTDEMFAQTSQQHPKAQVAKAIELTKLIINGEKVEEKVLIPTDSIHQGNLDQFVPEF